MALTISGTSNGKLGNLSLSNRTANVLDSGDTSFFGVDTYYLNTDHTVSGTTMTAWTRATTAKYGTIGTGMSVSSGHWTFPSTGIYLIQGTLGIQATSTANDNCAVLIQTTGDNFSTTEADRPYTYHYDQSFWSAMCALQFIFDCTDTANDKIRFQSSSLSSGNLITGQSNNLFRSVVSFIRLGDT